MLTNNVCNDVEATYISFYKRFQELEEKLLASFLNYTKNYLSTYNQVHSMVCSLFEACKKLLFFFSKKSFFLDNNYYSPKIICDGISVILIRIRIKV